MAVFFYQQLFQPDDVEDNPKPLLIELICRYTLMAEGMSYEAAMAVDPLPFRPAYVVIVGFPYLPSPAQVFLGWLADNLTQAKAQLNIHVDFFPVLYSEPFPQGWEFALNFWESQLLNHDSVGALIHSKT